MAKKEKMIHEGYYNADLGYALDQANDGDKTLWDKINNDDYDDAYSKLNKQDKANLKSLKKRDGGSFNFDSDATTSEDKTIKKIHNLDAKENQKAVKGVEHVALEGASALGIEVMDKKNKKPLVKPIGISAVEDTVENQVKGAGSAIKNGVEGLFKGHAKADSKSKESVKDFAKKAGEGKPVGDKQTIKADKAKFKKLEKEGQKNTNAHGKSLSKLKDKVKSDHHAIQHPEKHITKTKDQEAQI